MLPCVGRAAVNAEHLLVRSGDVLWPVVWTFALLRLTHVKICEYAVQAQASNGGCAQDMRFAQWKHSLLESDVFKPEQILSHLVVDESLFCANVAK